ncbi:hypothetical protein SAMN04489810_1637 [Microbacterium pygmaeum]|uniref:Uncharacterized protein n=1 Tax=Microbacterium pygmaeum TaxID=370764 RepID=A0A1G7Y6E9_9MICO|nr:hypothetical protein SAMN04489810_1637 [Microbacterium pygmaeum]
MSEAWAKLDNFVNQVRQELQLPALVGTRKSTL